MNTGGYSVQQSSYSYTKNTTSNVGGGLGGYGGGIGGGSGSGNAVLINSGLTDR
jgi:hypothetical protein